MQTFSIPKSLKEGMKYTFCPGCDHGVAIRIMAELIDEFDLKEKALTAASVGCSVFLYDFLNVDCVEAPHGRALACATGMKRAKPDKFVFTYQGDGDFASIGLAESMHAASRGELITSLCINNTLYGMTGGQLGPTTVLNQVTTTSPTGRNREYHGFPFKIAEHIALCEGTAFAARVSLDSPAAIMNAKKMIRKAFEVQLNGLGFGFVEVLSGCPTNWKKTPIEAHKHIRENLTQIYPLGVFKDITKEVK